MSALQSAALRLALHERAIYRTMAQAALDLLHERERCCDRQRDMIADLREQIARYGREMVRE